MSSAADNLVCPVLTLLHGQVELQPWCAERGEANPGWAESAHRTKGARPWSIRSGEKKKRLERNKWHGPQGLQPEGGGSRRSFVNGHGPCNRVACPNKTWIG